MNQPLSQQTQNNRISWIDAAKAGSILLVMIAHTNLAKIGSNPYPGQILDILSFLMASYMPVFFVLSGYTFKDKPGILKHKAVQILKPYICWALAYFLLLVITGISQGHFLPLYWCRMLAGCFYSRINAFTAEAGYSIQLFPYGAEPLWFLTALFVSYALYIPLHRAKKTIKIILVCSYLGMTLLLHQCPVLLPWSIDTAFAGALFIWGGQLFRKSELFLTLNIKSITIALIIAPLYLWSIRANGGSGGMYCRDFGRMDWYAPVIFIFMGLSGSYIWFILSQLLEKLHLSRVLAKIGEQTLLILCSHMFIYIVVAMFLRELLTNYKALTPLEPYAFLIQIASALAFAFIWNKTKIIRHIYQKIPFHKTI